MNWIERRLTSPGAAGLASVRIRVPPTPEAHAVLGSDAAAAFWNRAIDEWVSLLSNGAELPDRPTVPMPGGHGTLHTEGRADLCVSYLFARSPALRAHVVLHLLGAPAHHPPGGRGTREGYQAHAFRLAAAVWIEQHPIAVDGVDAGSQVVAGDRWMLLLAALYDLARLGLRSSEHYRAAVERCSHAVPIQPVVLRSRAGYGENGRQGAQRSRPEQWEHAGATLRAGATKADRLLAGLVLRVICSRLHVVLAGRPKRTNTFFVQLGAWLRDALQSTESAFRPDAQDCTGPDLRELESTALALLEMRPFGGSDDIDCGDGYPAEFRPYRGGSGVRLAKILRRLDPDVHAAVTRSHKLGAVIADRALDPIEIVFRGNRVQREPGDWLDHAAYWNLESLMRQSVNQMGWGDAEALPSSASRLQIQSFTREVKTQTRSEAQERTALAVREALKGAPPGCQADHIGCALCAVRVREPGRSTTR